MNHDAFCPNYQGPCCSWMGECNCQCICEEIADIRADEREKILSEISITECSMHDYDEGMCHISIEQLMDILENK